jgi:cytochrome P450 family 135
VLSRAVADAPDPAGDPGRRAGRTRRAAPARFRPERFLGDDPPDTYTWIPFGGGTRRCLGASFALMEMRIVLARVLERAALRPADPEPAQVQFRAITLSPRGGVRVIQDRPPAAA